MARGREKRWRGKAGERENKGSQPRACDAALLHLSTVLCAPRETLPLPLRPVITVIAIRCTRDGAVTGFGRKDCVMLARERLHSVRETETATETKRQWHSQRHRAGDNRDTIKEERQTRSQQKKRRGDTETQRSQRKKTETQSRATGHRDTETQRHRDRQTDAELERDRTRDRVSKPRNDQQQRGNTHTVTYPISVSV